MGDLLKKLSSYDLFVNFIPGYLFTYYLQAYKNITLIADDSTLATINIAIICYMIGLVVNRVGSLVIEPVAKMIGLVKFSPYADFVAAEKIDEKIKQLSEVNNFYRSIISLVTIIIILEFFFNLESMIIIMKTNHFIWLMVMLAAFMFSYRKQTKYISDRIEKALSKSKDDKIVDDNNKTVVIILRDQKKKK